MTAAEIINKLEAEWPKMLTPKQWGLARTGSLAIRHKLADMATARGGNVLTPLEWHEVSKWGVNDDQSRVTDHRKDGSFRRRNQAASKGEPRKMWSGRLPASTHEHLRSLVAGGEHASQADAIAAAVSALANALLGSVVCGACKYYLLARDPDTARPVHNYPGTCGIMHQIRPGFTLLPLAASQSINGKTDATACRFFLPNAEISNGSARKL